MEEGGYVDPNAVPRQPTWRTTAPEESLAKGPPLKDKVREKAFLALLPTVAVLIGAGVAGLLTNPGSESSPISYFRGAPVVLLLASGPTMLLLLLVRNITGDVVVVSIMTLTGAAAGWAGVASDDAQGMGLVLVWPTVTFLIMLPALLIARVASSIYWSDRKRGRSRRW